MRKFQLPLVLILFLLSSCDLLKRSVLVESDTKIVFSVQPSNASSGEVINPYVSVSFQGKDSGILTNVNEDITISISNDPTSGEASLSGVTTVRTQDGVATFYDLSIDKIGTNFSLKAETTDGTSVISETFNVELGNAHGLVFTQSPGNSTSLVNFSQDIKVSIVDAGGNVLNQGSNQIQLSLGSDPSGGEATLSGTLSVAAVNGVATFSGLSIDKAFSGYTLTASAADLQSGTSESFAITHGPATKLSFSRQPSNSTSQNNISPSVVVQILDASDNLVTTGNSSITLSIANDPSTGATLSGTLSKNAVSGFATFGDVKIDKSANGYTLSASSAGLTSATSSSFNITQGVPAKLAFKVQPESSVQFGPISSIQVEVQDSSGNVVANATNTVSLSFNHNPTGLGVLSGTTTVSAVNGVASFNDISIDVIANGYRLSAQSSGLTSVMSDAFNIFYWAIQYGANTKVSSSSYASKSNAGDDRCRKGKIDSNGYIYCAGTTNGNFLAQNAGTGTKDIFVIKYDPLTRKEVASIQLGADIVSNSSEINALNLDEEVTGIEVDSSGNVYIVGYTTSNLKETKQGLADIYVIKLNSALTTVIWAKHFGATTKLMTCPVGVTCGNTYADYATSVVMDSSGNLYVGGYTNSDIYNNTRHDNTYTEMFAFKMNSSGTVIWVYHPVDNTENSNDAILGLDIDSNYLYFGGYSGGFWIETPGSMPAGWAAEKDFMYGKLRLSDGGVEYLKQVNAADEGTAGIENTQYYDGLEGGVKVDSNGNLYMTGATRNAFGKPKAQAGTDFFDIVVLKADSSGDLVWTYHVGGDVDPVIESNLPNPQNADTVEYVSDIELDTSNNVYVLMRTKSNQFVTNASNKYDGIILRLDSDGDPIGANKGITQFAGANLLPGGSSSGNEAFYDFSIDNNGDFYIFGITDGAYNETAGGSWDPIIFKWSF